LVDTPRTRPDIPSSSEESTPRRRGLEPVPIWVHWIRADFAALHASFEGLRTELEVLNASRVVTPGDSPKPGMSPRFLQIKWLLEINIGYYVSATVNPAQLHYDPILAGVPSASPVSEPVEVAVEYRLEYPDSPPVQIRSAEGFSELLDALRRQFQTEIISREAVSTSVQKGECNGFKVRELTCTCRLAPLSRRLITR
jgi:hypothetical protein